MPMASGHECRRAVEQPASCVVNPQKCCSTSRTPRVHGDEEEYAGHGIVNPPHHISMVISVGMPTSKPPTTPRA